MHCKKTDMRMEKAFIFRKTSETSVGLLLFYHRLNTNGTLDIKQALAQQVASALQGKCTGRKLSLIHISEPTRPY